MADNNNAWLGKLPKNPHPALKQLEPLIGTWKVSGPDINGEWRYEWMEGGFFMIQHFNHRHRKRGEMLILLGRILWNSLLKQLACISEAELMKLHGMGPKALAQLRNALAAAGLAPLKEQP